MDSQNILSFGGLVKIIQGGGMAEEEQISVEVNSAYLTCSTEVFVPSTVWSHIIVSVRTWQGVRSVYLDGKLMANSSRFLCTSHDEVQDYDKPSLVAGGDGNVNFALDDVRLVFDGLEMPKIVESYKNITGKDINHKDNRKMTGLLGRRSQDVERMMMSRKYIYHISFFSRFWTNNLYSS